MDNKTVLLLSVPNGESQLKYLNDSGKHETTSANESRGFISNQITARESSYFKNKNHISNVEDFIEQSTTFNNKPKAYYAYRVSDLCELAVFEVSLEGLDGITIEALWTRISVALGDQDVSENLKNYFWDNIKFRNGIEFYILPNPRPKLVLYDREQNSEDDFPNEDTVDIYEHSAVNDKAKGILGSCKDYWSRKLIPNEDRYLRWQELFEKYENTLVVVASQNLRKHFLYHNLANPLVELLDNQYCTLERIGRSRKHGEITQGKISLQCIVKDPKVIFYYRKMLADQYLITKQTFVTKSPTGVSVSGNILHLIKFYYEIKVKSQALAEKIISALRQKPNFRMDYAELKTLMVYPEDRKIFKNNILNKIVKTEQVFYRELYPEAKRCEWKRKKMKKEKLLRVVELIDPCLNVDNCWNQEEEDSEMSSDDEPLDNISWNMSTLRQVFNLIHQSGSNGLTQKEIKLLTGFDFYTVRTITRTLSRNNQVQVLKLDRGAQRICRFYVNHLNDENIDLEEEKSSNDHEELLKKSNQHLSNLLGIEEYHLESIQHSTFENNFENSLTPYINISNNTGMPISKLKNELNIYKIKNQNLNSLSNEFSSYDVCKIENDNDDQFSKTYKNLVQIETNLCKNNFDFDICNYKSEIDFFLQGVTESFKEVCAKIINDNDIKKDKEIFKVNTEMEIDDINAITTKSPPMKEVYSLFKKIFLNNFSLEIPCNKISEFLKRMSMVKNKSNLFEIEQDLQKITEEFFNYKYYQLNPSISVVNFSNLKFGANDYFDLKQQNRKRKHDADPDLKIRGKERKISENVLDAITEIKNEMEIVNDEIVQTPTSKTIKEVHRTATDLRLMGVNPVIIKRTNCEDNILLTYYISTVPREFATEHSQYREEGSSTLKANVRAKAIIDKVRKDKIIFEVVKLAYFIRKLEQNLGYKTILDRKSLERIIGRLVIQGFIKVLKIVVQIQEDYRISYVICDPSVCIDNKMIYSMVDQLKIKIKTYHTSKGEEENRRKRKISVPDLTPQKISKSVGELNNLTKKSIDVAIKREKAAGMNYGYCPKFARVKILHKFLFYLIYSRDSIISNGDKDIRRVLKESKIFIEEDEINQFPPVYTDEVCPEMFVSSMPHYDGWPEGWTLISDVIIRMPVSMFFQLVNVNYAIPNLLDSYVNHPVKKNLPIKYLPANILKVMLIKRKYLAAIYQTLVNMCYVGLLQLGPQNYKNKDKYFIYLNRRTTLLDTTTSATGYHKVEEKEYQTLHFFFNEQKDVDCYWQNLWSIAIQTPLGQRYAILGETIQIDNVQYKPMMNMSLLPKTPEMALSDDNGEVPGDKKGAAGLDSALWVHLKRNWTWNKSTLDDKAEERKPNISELSKIKPVKFSEFKLQQQLKKTTKQGLLKKVVSKISSRPIKRKRDREIRKILPRRDIKKRRVKLDEVDKRIFKKMKNSRCVWEKSEDDILIMLRAAGLYFSENNRSRMVPAFVIRDILHKLSPISNNKTTPACSRRILWLLKDESIFRLSESIRNQVKINTYVRQIFGRFRESVMKGKYNRKEHLSAFTALAIYLYQKKIENNRVNDQFVDYLTSERLEFLNKTNLETDSPVVRSSYFEPKNANEILTETIKSIIHSALNCKADKIGWTYQIFQVYQKYPEPLLRKAVSDLRISEMISSRKKLKKERKHYAAAANFFQLNFRYTFTLNSARFSIAVFNDTIDMFEKICVSKSNCSTEDVFSIGKSFSLAELIFSSKVSVNLNIPAEPLSLNPDIVDHSDLFKTLALRCKRLLEMMDDNGENLESSSSTELNTGKKRPTLGSRAIQYVAIKIPDINSTKKVFENIVSSFSVEANEECKSCDDDLENNKDKVIIKHEKQNDQNNSSEQTDFKIHSEIPSSSQTKSVQDDITSPSCSKAPTSKVSSYGEISKLSLTKLMKEMTEGNNQEDTKRVLDPSKLAYLLKKGLFSDDNDDYLDKLDKHYVINTPEPCITLEEDNSYCEYFLKQFPKKCEALLQKILRDAFPPKFPLDDAIIKAMLFEKGVDSEMETVTKVVEFVRSKKAMGASFLEMKENFSNLIEGNNLLEIIQILIECHMFLLTGVTILKCVHTDYRSAWMCKSVTVKKDDYIKNNTDLEVQIYPWIRVNGTINRRMLNDWLRLALLHCIRNPLVSIDKLTKEMTFMKHVEVYQLLKYLESLDCIKFVSYVRPKVSLFSSNLPTEIVPANEFHHFSEICIEVSTNAVISLGMFLKVKTPSNNNIC